MLPGLRFGSLLETCSPPRATKRPFKKHTKFWSISISIFHRFCIDFGSVLGRFWEPCWPPRCTINWAPILNYFFIDFLSIFTRNWPPQNLSFDKQSTRNPCFWYFVRDRIFFKFYRFWVPTWSPKPTQKLPQINKKSIKNHVKNMIQFFINSLTLRVVAVDPCFSFSS